MSEVEFTRFRYEEQGYPRARVPMIPRLTLTALLAILGPENARQPFEKLSLFVRARYALYHALTACGADQTREVLLPAYHCTTMVEPVIRCGAKACFYRINSDLSPDLNHVAYLLKERSRHVCCLVLTHFFGFRQPAQTLLSMLAEHDVKLIEDCAHVMEPAPGLGDQGDVAVFCPAKFFPCSEGGALLSHGPEIRCSQHIRTGAIGFESRQLARLIRMATDNLGGRLDLVGLEDESRSDRKPITEGQLHDRRTIDTDRIISGQVSTYNPALENTRASRWSARIIACQDYDVVRQDRRRQFEWWLDNLTSMPNARPLFDKLDESGAPYIFPLLIEEPELQFNELKYLGMPIYRWDELANSDCHNADYYRTHLIQLPCHQDLDQKERQWLASTLQRGLRPTTANRVIP